MQNKTRVMAWGAAALIAAGGAAALWWSGSVRHGADTTLLTGSDPAAPFVVQDCAPRLFDDRPALALVFSQPVDRTQRLEGLLRVTDLGPAGAPAEPSAAADPAGKLVAGAWVVGENPRIAYFPFVTPQRKLRIAVAAGLLAGDGRKLAEVKTCELVSDAVAPSFYFASRGVVLPARQNGGLPIVTLNVPEVDVQFLRINPADLPRFLERVAGSRRAPASSDNETREDSGEGDAGGGSSFKGRVNGWELDQLKNSARSLYLGRYKTDGAPNQRRVTFLPVEDIPQLQTPGVYVAVMAQPGRFAQDYQVTYFYVSDIGLQVQRHARSLDAFATSLASGKALPGVAFELLDADARSLGRAAGDADGHALLASVPPAASLLVARRGTEMSLIVLREPGLDLSEFDIGGHPSRNTKLFVYAGRDLYRPGEAFSVSVLARDADGQALPPQPLSATLKRPDGRAVLTRNWPANDQQPGYFQHPIRLPADAMTGAWLLELRADPGAKQADASWKFQVEDFLPERMKLALQTAKPVLVRGEAFEVQVSGSYLYGAPAAGNRLLVSVAAERQRLAQPQRWPGFVFGDFADDERAQRQELADQTLDGKGQASVVLPLTATGAASPMRLRGSFSLLETGGRPVVRSIERTVWPAPALLALRPLFDRDVSAEGGVAEFELTRVDSAGAYAPLPAPGRVAMRLIREDRQYYWRYDEQKGWHSGYTETDEPQQSGQLTLSARAKLALKVGYGRYRVELDDPATGLKLRYRFYAGWGAQDAEAIGNRPDRVQVKLANAPLKAGEPARLVITPPHDGQALVTVQGDRLLWRQRIAVTTAGTALSIPMDPAWKRHDLYVTVTAFRPGSAGDRVTPARALGLLHLPLARDARQLKLSISAPAKVPPETRMTVKLRAEGLSGRPALVTLSAVDVGILNITRYASPDPVDFFFGKHRLAPELADLYGKLIEKMDGQRGKLAFGGDARLRDTRSLPKKLRLVNLFSGPVQLDAQGEASIAVDLPDFNGTLRLMAVVASADKFGHAEAQTVAAAPLVAELATPRFISPGDAATIALDLSNLTAETQAVTLKLEGADPLRVAEGGRSLTLQPNQRETLRFPVEATDAYGLGRLRLTVNSASGIHIQRESFLQVQPQQALERELRRARIEPGASLALDGKLLERYFKGSSSLSLSLSSQPPLNIKSLVRGLLDYPYGCLEQTASAAYPLLFIDEAAALALGLAPRSRAERALAVDSAVARLAGLQKANGGYTLWGEGPNELWLSAYVAGFLQEARLQGFAVPDAMVKKGQDGLLQELQQAPNRFPTLPKSAQPGPDGAVAGREFALLRDSHKRFAELAYAGYSLARDQKAPLALLRLLHDQYRGRALSPLPLVHLAIALQLMGDEARARVALDDAMARAYGIPGRQTASSGGEWLGDYGSPVRDLALSYALLQRHAMTHARRENLLFDAADRLGGRQYLSTQERLALFLAARAASGASGEGAGQAWAAQIKTGEQTVALASRTTETRTIDAAALARGVTLSNKAALPLFVEIDAAGYPLEPPAPKADVITLKRDWFDATGQPLAGRTVQVGDLLIVRLQARAKQTLADGLVVDRIPAGFEVENLNLSQGPKAGEFSVGGINVGQAMSDARIKHREYRDDRFVAAARLDGQPLNLFYLLRAVSPGRFGVPATFAEDMYRPELRAVGPAELPVSVVDRR